MFGRTTFYDRYGNFDNKKFLSLLEKAKIKRDNKISGSGILFKDKEIILFKRVKKIELWNFVNKLSIFLNSGVDIKGALGILIKQTKNVYMRKIITEIRQNIDYGISVSETMSNYPDVFDNLTSSLINVGEQTGQLGIILEELDLTLIENIELRGRVKGAMIYPLILIFLTLSMVTFMMVVIIPKITESFNEARVELPGLTQVIIGISDFLIEKWYLILIILFAFIVLVKLINSTYHGKIFFAGFFTKLPIFGFIVRQSNVIYFIKSFTLLQKSGVLLLDALKTSSRVVPNLLYKRELVRVKNEVEVGLTISKSLGLNLEYETNIYSNELFPEEFAYVVNTGEETGSLSKSLEKIGKNYNKEIKRYIGNLSTMMEPVIIVFVGFMVGTIVIAIMLPFFKLAKVAENL